MREVIITFTFACQFLKILWVTREYSFLQTIAHADDNLGIRNIKFLKSVNLHRQHSGRPVSYCAAGGNNVFFWGRHMDQMLKNSRERNEAMLDTLNANISKMALRWFTLLDALQLLGCAR